MSTHYDSTFSFARTVPFPTYYPSNKTPVTADVLEAGWITAFLTLFFCFLLIIPAIAGKQVGFYIIRFTVTLFIGLVIMWCNFGQEWEVGEVETKMFYKAGSNQEITGRVRLKLGLRSVNITLKATEPPEGDLSGETIDYNERFYWTWSQGRAGFGRFAGLIQRSFREAQIKGLPYPILWAAEYFTFDGEGFRFGRYYRLAGWYAHMCMWVCFPLWILCIITARYVIIYTAKLMMLMGGFLTSAAIIWSSHRNFNELAIVYDNSSTGILKTHFGLHWYLTLFTGIFCVIAGAVMYLLSFNHHDQLCRIFDINPVDVLEIDQGFELDTEETEGQQDVEQGMQMEELNKPKPKRKMTLRYRSKGAPRWSKSIKFGNEISAPAPPRRGKSKDASQGHQVEQPPMPPPRGESQNPQHTNMEEMYPQLPASDAYPDYFDEKEEDEDFYSNVMIQQPNQQQYGRGGY